jgi:hypothetical protein
MDIYSAIMKAADQIDLNPHLFEFHRLKVPADCGTPGCAIGLVAINAGMCRAEYISDACETVLGVSDGEFYERMRQLYSPREMLNPWTRDAGSAAILLRRYAAKYHNDSKPKRTGIPASVRGIFDGSVRVDLESVA